MFQRPPSVVEERHQRARALGELEAAEPLVPHVGAAAADHVADVQLGHLVVGQIDGLVAARRVERRGEPRRILARLGRDADEDVRALAAAQAVVELGDDAPADRGAELAEGAGRVRES